MPRLARVLSSPHSEDTDFPWEYEEDSFVHWVDEVFLEGYKQGDDAPFPSFEECIDIIKGNGYHVEITEK